ncbi:putative quinol monooxygenase [Streptomyces sp. NBC_01198]|uniref:putative quinol monooxygenase n=1 Tax=Streptomyces sp. NBC_01198 TaxID=2903769 RepID=UPI002E0DF2A3|nr:antibiotic biosynthesis monooxygenase [Streptomyces sp. NBC_01198]
MPEGREAAEREDMLMAVKYGLLVLLEAQKGKEAELAAFLEQGREMAVAEPGTVTWYAFRTDESRFGIFDTFESEDGRRAHLSGPIASALADVTETLLAHPPRIQQVDVLAVK